MEEQLVFPVCQLREPNLKLYYRLERHDEEQYTFDDWISFFAAPFFGQNLEGVRHIERAKTGLKTAEEDTNKVLLYVDLCMAYQWYNEDSLRWYSDLGLKLAHKLNFPRGEIRLLVSQSISLNFKGDASKALQILFDALRKAEAFDLRQEQEICLMNIGAGYFFLNDMTNSQEYLRRAKVIEDSLSPATDDLYWKWYLYLWLGSNFSDLNQLDSANYFLNLAYEGVQSPEFIDKFNLVPTISMFYSELLAKKEKTLPHSGC